VARSAHVPALEHVPPESHIGISLYLPPPADRFILWCRICDTTFIFIHFTYIR
jgi:hypothetical protein